MSLAALATLNLVFLIATGNRGGFLTLIGGGGLFLYFFRKRLGAVKTVNILLVGTMALGIASYIVVYHTQFNSLYQRLESTEFEEGMPDTRATTWQTSMSKIVEKPMLGHGPRLRLPDDWIQDYPGHESITFPHNLYLYLLYTVGITGTVAYLLFFGLIARRFWKRASITTGDELSDGMAKLGTLMIILVAIDELKIEFLRFSTVDYLQFIFAFLAIFLATCDARTRPENPQDQAVYGRVA
jgi:O-antigen ligase